MEYDMPLYRPPSEADSLIIQATYGCSANDCTFCYMYKGKKFRIRRVEEVKQDIDWCASQWSGSDPRLSGRRRCAGHPLVPAPRNPRTPAQKIPPARTRDQLRQPAQPDRQAAGELDAIRKAGLSMLYYGVESGDRGSAPAGEEEGRPGDHGRRHRQGASGGVRDFRHRAARARGPGRNRPPRGRNRRPPQPPPTRIRQRAHPHAQAARTGLRQKHGPGYEWLDKTKVLMELRRLIGGLELKNTVFRTNHASNWLPLKGTLNRDKDAMLRAISRALTDPRMLRKDEWRAL
ncbi:MAG: hypothetical protein MZU95_15860 [Desulfomicrobium escambiense]|nr:hypothetical protein [Desulfomicrobium escambiense]